MNIIPNDPVTPTFINTDKQFKYQHYNHFYKILKKKKKSLKIMKMKKKSSVRMIGDVNMVILELVVVVAIVHQSLLGYHGYLRLMLYHVSYCSMVVSHPVVTLEQPSYHGYQASLHKISGNRFHQ